MVKIQLELSEKANKNIEGFMYLRSIKDKRIAVNVAIEELSLKDDMTTWLEEQEKGDAK